MKADRCGAWAEQKRYRMGWITNAERKQKVQEGKLRPGHKDGEKCGCCTQASSIRISGGLHCDKGDFATRLNCYCNDFTRKEGA